MLSAPPGPHELHPNPVLLRSLRLSEQVLESAGPVLENSKRIPTKQATIGDSGAEVLLRNQNQGENSFVCTRVALNTSGSAPRPSSRLPFGDKNSSKSSLLLLCLRSYVDFAGLNPHLDDQTISLVEMELTIVFPRWKRD